MSKNYVDNKKFYQEISTYLEKLEKSKEEGTNPPKIPEYIGYAIFKIAENLSTMRRFIGYSYRDEMISDGIENCFLYLHNFDHRKYTNPFAYFTRIVYFAFVRRIKAEQKEQYVRQKSMMNSYILNSDPHLNNLLDSQDFLKANEVIEKFETKVEEKKKEKKNKNAVTTILDLQEE